MKNLSITRKLTLLFILFGGVLMVGLSVAAYLKGRDSLRSATVSELLSTALEKQAALNAWFKERETVIGDIADQDHLRTSVAAYMSAAADSTEAVRAHDELVKDLRDWVGEGHQFLYLNVIDAQTGRVVASTDPSEEGKYKEDQPYFIYGKRAAYVQNPYYDISLQQPRITAAAPVYSPVVSSAAGGDRKLAAVLAGGFNMGDMEQIIQRRTGLHQSDDAFLVNTSNLYVTQPYLALDPSIFQRGIHTEAVNRCLAHNSGVLEALDYRNVPVIVVYRWLPERQLCLIAKVDQSEAYAPVEALGTTMVLSGGAILLIGSILAYGMSRTISNPIRSLVHGVEEIGQGNLARRIEIKSRDEIGRLGQEINNMAVAIAERNAQLQDTLELNQKIIASSSLGVFACRAEGPCIIANPAVARISGATVEKMLQLNFRKLENWKKNGLFEKTEAALATGEEQQAEIHVTTTFGRDVWIKYYITTFTNNSELHFLMLVDDVTERKRSEEELMKYHDHLEEMVKERTAALSESEEKFKALYNNSQVGMYRSKLDGSGFITINDKLCETFGYSMEEMMADPATMRWADPEKRKEMIAQLRQTGELKNYEVVIVNKSGEHRTVLTSIKLYPDLGYLEGTALDITERKVAEENLKKAMDDLNRSNAELERFAYVASHDLQEPLRMVTSYMQLLEKRYKDKLDGDALEFINYAVDGSNRMKTLINDLLTYSRVGTHGAKFTSVDCEAVLRQVLLTLEVAIDENNATITHNPLPTVLADGIQLGQLFQNLIGNAIKFHGQKAPEIHVDVEKKGKEWVFSVRDNGIGIDPQYYERVFIIFQRLHNREEYPGTGIGLAISKRIVERHGGRIWIESRSGNGSTFFFTLPTNGEKT